MLPCPATAQYVHCEQDGAYIECDNGSRYYPSAPGFYDQEKKGAGYKDNPKTEYGRLDDPDHVEKRTKRAEEWELDRIEREQEAEAGREAEESARQAEIDAEREEREAKMHEEQKRRTADLLGITNPVTVDADGFFE